MLRHTLQRSIKIRRLSQNYKNNIHHRSKGTTRTSTSKIKDNSIIMSTSANNNPNQKYDASNLTDEQLAMKAQEELNMEGEMEEVSFRQSHCHSVRSEHLGSSFALQNLRETMNQMNEYPSALSQRFMIQGHFAEHIVLNKYIIVPLDCISLKVRGSRWHFVTF